MKTDQDFEDLGLNDRGGLLLMIMSLMLGVN